MAKESGFQVSGNAAECYQRYVAPNYTGPWATALVEVAGVGLGHRVLDAACGTGVVARAAARAAGEGGEVIGLDVNAGMLAVAAEVPYDGPAALRWHEAGVSDTGLDSETFDVVVSQQGLQYFPDRLRALTELRRILKPEGRLTMSVWKEHSAFTWALAEAAGRHISEEAGKQLRSQRTTPPISEIHAELATAGFRDPSIDVQTREVRLPAPQEYVPQHVSAMPIAAGFAALDERAQRDMIRDVVTGLGESVVDGQIVFEDAVYLVSGIR